MGRIDLYKNSKIRHLLCLIALSIFIGLAAQGCASANVANPIPVEHKKSDFRFEDHANFEDFRKSIRSLFPVGTNKSDIDSVMIGKNGARYFESYEDKSPYKRLEEGDKLVRYIKDYRRELECKFFVIAIYDHKDRLKKELHGYFGCTGP